MDPGLHKADNVTCIFMLKYTGIMSISEMYKAGARCFTGLQIENGEKMVDEVLVDAIFKDCYFSIDFSHSDLTNVKFIGCNLKCSDFSGCNLTNVIFEDCLLEGVEFKSALVKNASFNHCYSFGQLVLFEKYSGRIGISKFPLVSELYENVPAFSDMVDHTDDELNYVVYGELSFVLFDEITKNDSITDFTIKCFRFFNMLGERESDEIDNLLVVGVFEGLYSNKKCNSVALQLLTGKAKTLYEYWMTNGNIRSDF